MDNIKEIFYKNEYYNKITIYKFKNKEELLSKFRNWKPRGNTYFNDNSDNADNKIRNYFELNEYPKYIGFHFIYSDDHADGYCYYDSDTLKLMMEQEIKAIKKSLKFIKNK